MSGIKAKSLSISFVHQSSLPVLYVCWIFLQICILPVSTLLLASDYITWTFLLSSFSWAQPSEEHQKKIPKWEKRKVGHFNILGSLLTLLQGNSGHFPPLRPQHLSPAPLPQLECFPDPGTAKLLASSGLSWQRLPAA